MSWMKHHLRSSDVFLRIPLPKRPCVNMLSYCPLFTHVFHSHTRIVLRVLKDIPFRFPVLCGAPSSHISRSSHVRYVAIADRDLFGELHGVYHGHNLNGTKFWQGGIGRGSQRWPFEKDAPRSPAGSDGGRPYDNAGGCGDCGCFTELQTGEVAHSKVSNAPVTIKINNVFTPTHSRASLRHLAYFPSRPVYHYHSYSLHSKGELTPTLKICRLIVP